MGELGQSSLCTSEIKSTRYVLPCLVSMFSVHRQVFCTEYELVLQYSFLFDTPSSWQRLARRCWVCLATLEHCPYRDTAPHVPGNRFVLCRRAADFQVPYRQLLF